MIEKLKFRQTKTYVNKNYKIKYFNVRNYSLSNCDFAVLFKLFGDSLFNFVSKTLTISISSLLCYRLSNSTLMFVIN